MSKLINSDNIHYVFYSLYEGEDEDGNEVYRRTEVAIKSELDAIPSIISLEELNMLKAKLHAAEECIYSIEDALDRGNDNDYAREAIDAYNQKYKNKTNSDNCNL